MNDIYARDLRGEQVPPIIIMANKTAGRTGYLYDNNR